MGIFDFLRKSSPPPAGGQPVDKKVQSLAKVAADKRAQTYDRLEALQGLVQLKTPAAAIALLKRFQFSIDPSITDQEEKDLAFQGILGAVQPGPGKSKEEAEKHCDELVEAIRAQAEKAEQITWLLKLLRELLDEQGYTDELLNILERFDTEYARNVEPKVSVIRALESSKSDDVRANVERFLEDVNETVRFHAVETVFAQDDPRSAPPLAKLICEEESVRVKNKIAEGLAIRGWAIPAGDVAAVQNALRDTSGYSVNTSQQIVRR